LALAQYRELAAFSQFASDLDDATRAQLEHGQSVTELMKQHQYSPMSVADMAISLFAANEGFLTDVALPKVGSFEAALIAYMNSEHSAVMNQVNESGDFNGDIAANFKSALEQFKATQTW